MYKSIKTKIYSSICSHGRGSVFVARDFAKFGTDTAIHKALTQLVKDGVLRKLRQGVYDYPKIHDRIGMLSPSLDAVAKAIARSRGSRLQVSGAQAANQLGLSTQVPAQTVYLTDGMSRQVKIGNQTIRFQQTTPRNLIGAGTPVGAVLQALRFLGKSGVDLSVIDELQHSLADQDKKRLLRESDAFPAWQRDVLQQIAEPQLKAA